MKSKNNEFGRRDFLKLVGITAAITQFPHLANGATSEKLAKDQVLEYQLGTLKDLAAVDPAFCTGDTRGVTIAIFNPLVELVPGTIDQFRPCLAENWEVSKDNMTWTFSLRKGVEFHQNFGELTAEDVKFSFDRLKEIKALWQRPTFKGVEIVNKYTVRITTEAPDAFFLYKVTNFNGGEIVSKKAVQSIGDKTFKFKPIGGTGPFEFAEYIPGKTVTLVRNPKYFRGKPILEKVDFVFIIDVNSRLLALKKGDVHIITGLDEQQWVNAREKEGFKNFGRNKISLMLHLNMSKKPFDSLKVRQAMMYAINREELSKFFGGRLEAQYAHMSSSIPGGVKKEEIPEKYLYLYDPDRAKKLLAEAGYPEGFTIEMVNHDRKLYVVIMEMVQAQLKRVGIDLKFTASDVALYYDAIFKNRNPIVIWAPVLITPDDHFTKYWHSSSIVTKPSGSLNWSNYGDIAGNIDQLLDEARKNFDAKKRDELYRKAQIMLWEDLPTIPLLHIGVGNSFLQPYVDLGYEYINNPDATFQLTEKTRLLEH